MKYLDANLIQESFLRLRQNEPGGKRGLERTSAVVYFLAFDAMLKRTGIKTPVDLDPEENIGKNNRDRFTREFTRIVHIKNIGQKSCQVLNLGEVSISSTQPEKRFSANFLTVPLKEATTMNSESVYPNRPKPLFIMGPQATGLTWGIDRHPDWKQNLPCFFQERKTNTPFHDLACFVLRKYGFESSAASLEDGIADALGEIFTSDLCEYWKSKLSLEKPYVRSAANHFQPECPDVFSDHSWALIEKEADEAAALAARVAYLEGLLKMHDIAFKK